MTTAAWLILAFFSVFAFPISPMPRRAGSWDIVHSGRRFAEQGFLANKLQPVWSPDQHPAAYLTYTHYPPLPYWMAGLVEELAPTPQARIQLVNHSIRLLGLAALALSYLFARQLGCSVAAAALVSALTATSSWMWTEISTQATWYGWCVPLLLGSLLAFVYALRPSTERWKTALGIGGVLALANAFSAYQAWSWYPTFFGALLALGGFGSKRDVPQPRVLYGFLLSSAAIGAAIALRAGINWWHFGDLHTTLRDFLEAYQARAAGGAAGFGIEENRANYWNLPEQSRSRWQMLALVAQEFPKGMIAACLPGWPASAWIAGVALVSAGAGWLARWRTRPRALDPRGSSSRRQLSLALLAAPLSFIVVCPAISLDQWRGNTFWMFPAWIALCGFTLHSALQLATRAVAWRTGALAADRLITWPALTFALLAPLASMRDPTPIDPEERQVSLSEAEAITRAFEGWSGVVFTNADDHNPFMFVLPLDSKVAFKPWWALTVPAGKKALDDDESITLLVAERLARGVPSFLLESRWSVARRELKGLPSGWRLLEFRRAGAPP